MLKDSKAKFSVLIFFYDIFTLDFSLECLQYELERMVCGGGKKYLALLNLCAKSYIEIGCMLDKRLGYSFPRDPTTTTAEKKREKRQSQDPILQFE